MYNLLREKLAQDKQSEDASIKSDERSENDATGLQERLKETGYVRDIGCTGESQERLGSSGCRRGVSDNQEGMMECKVRSDG